MPSRPGSSTSLFDTLRNPPRSKGRAGDLGTHSADPLWKGLDMGITSCVEWIDANYARVALSNKAPNRKVRKSHVMSMARDMLDGFWNLNGETVVFDTSGALVEGQHRMHAIIEADSVRPGIRVQMLVVRDAKVGCRYNMGKVRKTADQYTIDGGKDATRVMALAKTIHEWDDETGLSPRAAAVSPTYDQLSSIVTGDPSILEVAIVYEKTSETMYSKHALWFCRWLMNRVPGGLDWLNDVLAGAGLRIGSPELLLRNYLLRNRQQKNSVSHSHRLTSVVAPVCVTIKAWNAHVSRRPIEALRYSEVDKFPIPIGLR